MAQIELLDFIWVSLGVIVLLVSVLKKLNIFIGILSLIIGVIVTVAINPITANILIPIRNVAFFGAGLTTFTVGAIFWLVSVLILFIVMFFNAVFTKGKKVVQ